MRGMEVIDTGSSSESVRSVEATLGLIFNVLGEHVDNLDDLTDPPCPATTFAHLDATTALLSRGLAAKGIYPAVDPLDSTSTMLQPRIVGEEHYETARKELSKLHNVTKNLRTL
ncbi:hypothetical protein IFM89_037877 [Coptis chinensis]|uniref:H(+)-transporting two-sector ATPase n=1 Tax=Coptis chinensis TaxID=261450 RepID=A0A835LYB5_9MAGN|nr:hypothetical protein IFM89_037877 [Coptis chinensis]